ncbi:MAG TPA: CAP domain-containing protein, partial [Gemmatimonadaceae bacterium]|nr:CAP domain-containing protein [Gemmatimonadaceae bacterium]
RDGSSPSVRVNRYGRWDGRLTESIAYGPATPEDVVIDLLVDDGVRDRGHRRNLLDPGVRIAGIACGPHRTYRMMCVIDLAAGYLER